MGDGSIARAFHDATKHTVERVQGSDHVLDWANKPHPFKVYEDDLDVVRLPGASRTGVPAVEALDSQGDGGGLDLAGLARLLVLGAGVIRKLERGGQAIHFRTYASAGALYPVELYVCSGELDGLGAGVYHFGPLEKGLVRLRSGDRRPELVRAAGREPAVQEAEVVLVCSGIPWRTSWKYTERGYRHLFWDCGTILANVLGLAASAGLSARVVTGFVDAEVGSVCGLDGEREFPLCMVALGAGAGVPAAEGPPEAVVRAERPLSRERVEYPAIGEVNDAGRLEDPDAVVGWRRGDPGSGPSDGDEQVDLPAPPPADADLEGVIRRRGSTRRFGRRPMPAGVLRSVLEAGTADIPADVRSGLVRPYLVAHAVEGVGPGAYAWAEGGLVPLRGGDLRREAGYLCLGQRLGATGAVTIFLMADLEAALDAWGDRGYRIAELAGGIAAGRMYLAAHAHGFGATGLTFFDDDVRDFFSPHASGLDCMLVVAVGERMGRLLPLA